MDCPECGHTLSSMDQECPKCRTLVQRPVAQRPAVQRRSQAGVRQASPKSSVKLAYFALAGILLLGVVAASYNAANKSGKTPEYKYTIYDSSVNQMGIPVQAVTALAAPGLKAGSYKAIAQDLADKLFQGKNGAAWVFDDATAEQLQWKSGLQWKKEAVDLTPQESAIYNQHLKGQVISRGKVLEAVGE